MTTVPPARSTGYEPMTHSRVSWIAPGRHYDP